MLGISARNQEWVNHSGPSKWGVGKFIKIQIPRANREVPGSLENHCSKSSSLRGPVIPSPSKAGPVFQLECSLQDTCLKSILVLEGIYMQRGPSPRGKSAGSGLRFRTWSPTAWGSSWDSVPGGVLIRDCIKMSYTFCHFLCVRYCIKFFTHVILSHPHDSFVRLKLIFADG